MALVLMGNWPLQSSWHGPCHIMSSSGKAWMSFHPKRSILNDNLEAIMLFDLLFFFFFLSFLSYDSYFIVVNELLVSNLKRGIVVLGCSIITWLYSGLVKLVTWYNTDDLLPSPATTCVLRYCCLCHRPFPLHLFRKKNLTSRQAFVCGLYDDARGIFNFQVLYMKEYIKIVID